MYCKLPPPPIKTNKQTKQLLKAGILPFEVELAKIHIMYQKYTALTDLLATKISAVNLSAFIYILFHEGFSPVIGTNTDLYVYSLAILCAHNMIFASFIIIHSDKEPTFH